MPVPPPDLTLPYICVLQLRYAAARGAPEGFDTGARARDLDEAVSAMQAKRGSSVLAFSDYMMFSPTYEPISRARVG